MKFENSALFNEIKHYKLEMNYGTYYLCEKFVIGEINEGVHFDSIKAELIVSEIFSFYGAHPKICLISNRVNAYSVNPLVWINIMTKYPKFLVASCIITYNSISRRNATLEKEFSKKSIKRCSNLTEAINWVEQLDEFN
ncbi:hypothetical protein [Winogradskyella sp. PE311]|uniref:hypothetical protein n=1 Tax=Winogradskyella sp. PE311 TaxID=3366943 RepID=UPI00397F0EB4